MEKGKIIGVYNYGKIHRYVIEKKKDIHGVFCNLLEELGFNDDQVLTADVIFDDLENEYLYIGESPEGFEAQLFIATNKINLIIKTNKTSEELTGILKRYFKFPQ